MVRPINSLSFPQPWRTSYAYSLLAAGGELVWTVWVPVVEPSCVCEPEKTRANFRPMSESRISR
jgi:hypothetical protein